MTDNDIRVTLEIGPKGKKVVAAAAEWPGLERGGKAEEESVVFLKDKVDLKVYQ